ncbi:MAG: hypothetical protein GXO79_13005 [Chlorobi bacterium]|nr:hypothetical protein [Chlorobiota bacterium]
MKKLSLLLIVFMVSFSINNYAGNADLFKYNDKAINEHFSDLTQLESYVNDTHYSLNELKNSNPSLLISFQLSNLNVLQPLTTYQLSGFDLGAFAWGFCCWPVGIFTILLDDDEPKSARISYFMGVGAAILFGGAGYGAF